MSLDTLAIASVVVSLYLFYTSVKVVRESRRLVVFRLGQCIGAKGPGLVYLVPFVDRAVSVDLGEALIEIRPVICPTQDSESIAMDLFLRWRILDPAKAVLAVADVTSALRRVAAATACSIVGAMALGDALTQRASVGRDLREKLRKVAETWGVGVTGVEIREVRRAAASSTL